MQAPCRLLEVVAEGPSQPDYWLVGTRWCGPKNSFRHILPPVELVLLRQFRACIGLVFPLPIIAPPPQARA